MLAPVSLVEGKVGWRGAMGVGVLETELGATPIKLERPVVGEFGWRARAGVVYGAAPRWGFPGRFRAGEGVVCVRVWCGA